MRRPALPGVPQSALPEAVSAVLPDTTPAPPWPCRVEAVVWWHRAVPAARGLLPAPLRAGLPITVGAFVRYVDSPVGAYSEVLASPVLVRGALRRLVLARVSVPFIAVDSVASVAGGRDHWALPKVLAAFTGWDATGDGWHVAASPTASGPELPVWGRLGATQVGADGQATSSVTTTRARVRVARVEVTSDLPWLPSGRHRGLELVGRMSVGPATPG